MGRRRTLPENAVQLTVYLAPDYVELLDRIRLSAVPDKQVPRTTIMGHAAEIGLEMMARELGLPHGSQAEVESEEG